MDKLMEQARFIELIKENPVLYDMAHPNYKDTDTVKKNAWMEVAAEWEIASGENIDLDKVQKKWVNIRDTFTAHKRRYELALESRLPANIPKWRLWDHMTWYAEFTKKKPIGNTKLFEDKDTLTDNLIFEMRNRPYLWNQTLSNYNTRRQQEIREVGSILGVKPLVINTRLNSLKTTFIRHRKLYNERLALTDNVQDVSKPKWGYWDDLQFMQDLPFKARGSYDTAEKRRWDELSEDGFSDDVNMIAEVESDSDDSDFTSVQLNTYKTQPRRATYHANTPRAPTKHPTLERRKQAHTETKDQFDKFGDSIAAQIKSLNNAKKQSLAMLKIQETLHTVAYGAEETSTEKKSSS